MRNVSATSLLEYLYDQLDMLATVDLTDEVKVEGACAVNRAVNATAKSIVSVAELSLRAYDSKPDTCPADTVRGFFAGE